MNTQTLQHALSQLLHAMQQQMAELDQAISDVELRLRKGAKRVQRARQSTTLAKSGGRSSAGWTEAARAQVAARMRAYWQTWREQKALPAQSAEGLDLRPGAREAKGTALLSALTARGVKAARTPDDRAANAAQPGPEARTTGGRSTAGWTPQARALAAARMRARWRGHKQAHQTNREESCD